MNAKEFLDMKHSVLIGGRLYVDTMYNLLEEFEEMKDREFAKDREKLIDYIEILEVQQHDWIWKRRYELLFAEKDKLISRVKELEELVAEENGCSKGWKNIAEQRQKEIDNLREKQYLLEYQNIILDKTNKDWKLTFNNINDKMERISDILEEL